MNCASKGLVKRPSTNIPRERGRKLKKVVYFEIKMQLVTLGFLTMSLLTFCRLPGPQKEVLAKQRLQQQLHSLVA